MSRCLSYILSLDRNEVAIARVEAGNRIPLASPAHEMIRKVRAHLGSLHAARNESKLWRRRLPLLDSGLLQLLPELGGPHLREPGPNLLQLTGRGMEPAVPHVAVPRLAGPVRVLPVFCTSASSTSE